MALRTKRVVLARILSLACALTAMTLAEDTLPGHPQAKLQGNDYPTTVPSTDQGALLSKSAGAADDRLCLNPETLSGSQTLVARFQNARSPDAMSRTNFSRLFDEIGFGLKHLGGVDLLHHCQGEGYTYVELDGRRVNCTDIKSQCASLDEIYKRYSSKDGLSVSNITKAIQDSVLLLTNPNCVIKFSHRGQRPPINKVWMYGTGFVVCLLILSNLGGLMTPLMSQQYFKRLLQFLVAMGAGTLIATGVFVLIPEAFDIVTVEELGDDYIWKGAALLLTAYCFFIAEQFLKFGIKARDAAKRAPKRQQSFVVPTPKRQESFVDSPGVETKAFFSTDDELVKALNDCNEANHESPFIIEDQPVTLPLDHGHSHFPDLSKSEHQSVASVAWVLMMGDLIHKVVDGVAVGAAFTESLQMGITIGVSVIFEEFPHELGDVAILIHSGMTMKKALFVNSLTASASFAGLVLGIMLGDNTDSTRWVLAVAAGVFLYVPMADMLPEMSQHLEVKISEARNKVTREVWILMACQSAGLLMGMGVIFLVVNFADMIQVS